VSSDNPTVYECPRCHQHSGRQDRFALHARDEIKVIVRCEGCGHRWSVIVRAETPAGAAPSRRG
jgi:DNA-directed RNA polymerase subunit RPC12/RpoP